MLIDGRVSHSHFEHMIYKRSGLVYVRTLYVTLKVNAFLVRHLPLVTL